MALLRCMTSAAVLLAGAAALRKKTKQQGSGSKFIAGVPVLNYQAAYGGAGSLSTLEESREEEWIVILQAGTTDAQIAALCQQSRKGCKLSGHPDKGGVAFLDMRGTETDLEVVIQSNRAIVKFAEPNQALYMIPELEAEQASANWGLNRVGASGRSSNQGANTHIYILDGGVRTTHQDFGNRASPAVDYSLGYPQECNGNLACATDRNGHGTHCAGSAAGTTFGVATQAFVHGVKCLGDDGTGDYAVITSAIDFIASSEARPAVGSMSLGGQCYLGQCDLYSAVVAAVNAAVESGVTIVVAAGNSNMNACDFVPAFVPSAITVGSTDSNDARSPFSNYGRCTNIWAPGSAITSASHLDDTGSRTGSGTSFACPHVAGAAALALERHPDWQPEQVLDSLLSNAATFYITDLLASDTNKLLYVAADAPPPKGDVPPVTCPSYCTICLLSACKGCCE